MSGSAPRVAVVVPCFNAGAFLVEAIESAAHEADELVIVDDGSSDQATLDILRQLERRGFVVLHQENRGLAAARMAGVGATTSPYLLPLDSDDVLEEGAIRELAEALDRAPSAAVAWGDLRTFGSSSYRVPSVPALDPWFITYASMMPVTSLYRRSALERVHGWQLTTALEDWDLWMAFAEHRLTGVYVPRVVYRYRRQATSMLSTSLGQYGEIYAELRRRHEPLFRERRTNRRSSEAPFLVRALLPLIDHVPGLSPLAKLWASQTVTYLTWNGGPRTTAALLARAAVARLRLRSLVAR